MVNNLKAWFDDVNITKLSEEQLEEMAEDFRYIYKDLPGSRVLLTQLMSLCFFSECKTEAEMILNNQAKILLARLGIWRPENAAKIIEKLMEVM